MNYTSPREFAKSMLAPYIERGDSVESIIAGHMGVGGGGYSAHVGGYVVKTNKDPDMRKWKSTAIKSTEVAVSEFAGQEVCHIFNIYELAQEIKNKTKQLTLI